MRTFEHPKKYAFDKVVPGMTVTKSKYNGSTHAKYTIMQIYNLERNSPPEDMQFLLVPIGLNKGTIHFIFNLDGKSFWEEIYDFS